MKYERCKRLGHQWDDAPNLRYEPRQPHPLAVTVEHARCVGQCGGERHFQLDASGVVVARKYDLPLDYAWNGDADQRPTRADLRQARIKPKARPRKGKAPARRLRVVA